MNDNPLLADLNPSQLEAATFSGRHALVEAGAGCGKTKTIIARCQHLISSGVSPQQIYVMTFTRRSAEEIVARVKAKLGERAAELRASTFHAFCMWLMHKYPGTFGRKGFSIIDRDDQLSVMKALKGRRKKDSDPLPSPATLVDIYSYARNTLCSLTDALNRQDPAFLEKKDLFAQIFRAYEARKLERKYLDYDDILDVVATTLQSNPDVAARVVGIFRHMLVDECQDTNALQWKLLAPFAEGGHLFLVGDPAQSIYGFRGSDFRNIHELPSRLPGLTVLKLQDNYRSTQEILDLSNWLLDQSMLAYGKELRATRGPGLKPVLHTFRHEMEEASFIVEDVARRIGEGAKLRDHMILIRSAFAGRGIEALLVERNIPYRYIGGTKLFASSHVRDVLSAVRLLVNAADEIAWMRFLQLFPGIGEVSANRIVTMILGELAEDTTAPAATTAPSMESLLDVLSNSGAGARLAQAVLKQLHQMDAPPKEVIATAGRLMSPTLEGLYRNDWDRRRRDLVLLERLGERQPTLAAFIEAYMLDPVHASSVDELQNKDAVVLITVHSAKGTEAPVCYVPHVSIGAYPSGLALSSDDDVEEERRVLYVALTRAQNELIVTRRGLSDFMFTPPTADATDRYFLAGLPDSLADETVHAQPAPIAAGGLPPATSAVRPGMDFS